MTSPATSNIVASVQMDSPAGMHSCDAVLKQRAAGIWAFVLLAVALGLAPQVGHGQQGVGAAAVSLIGVRLEVQAPTVPINVPFGLPTSVRGPGNVVLTDLTALGGDASWAAGLRVTATLSGPGLDPTALEPVVPGASFAVGALTRAGSYTVEDLQLEDANGAVVLRGEPGVITVLDRVLVTSVSSRALSLEEILARGIVIDEDNFTVYEFTFGVATESPQAPIPFDMIIPTGPEEDDAGSGTLPPVIPGLEVPSLDVQGFLFETETMVPEGVELPPIPGVILIPGNIGFLNDFFQVLVAVSNVAPPASQLVVTEAAAVLELPLGDDGQHDYESPSSDDPLWPAETANPPEVYPLCTETAALHDRLCTGVRNVAAGRDEFGPGEQGEGELLVEGRLVGTHRLRVKIHATLTLTTGDPVKLVGNALGTVLVRDRSVSMSISHPEVVRAGETYSLFITMHNTGTSAAPLVTLALDPTQISGATYVSNTFDQPIPTLLPVISPGTAAIGDLAIDDTVTVEYRLIARKSGRVTAAAFQAQAGVSGGFALRTGVGDRGIPLSPDTLVLPAYAHDLPERFHDVALRVLGLAHSVATTPAAQSTGQITRIKPALVQTRAQELTEAGPRIRIGQDTPRELLELWLDWLGNASADAGFDDIMRTTGAGRELESALVHDLAACQADEPGCLGDSVLDLQASFGAAEVYRGGFVSVAATGAADIRVLEGSGAGEVATHGACAAAACGTSAPNGRGVPLASLLDLAGTGSFVGGEWAVIGQSHTIGQMPAPRPLRFEISGSGSSDVEILFPGPDGTVRRARIAGAALGAVPITVEYGSNGELSAPGATLEELDPFTRAAPPAVLGVRQIPESDALERGRVVAVLFDQAVHPDSVSDAAGFELRYAPGQAAARAIGPTGNTLLRARVLPQQRIVLLSFTASVSRFFAYELGLRAIKDPENHVLLPDAGSEWATRPVVGDFPTPVGGIVSGTVRDGNANPLPLAAVTLTETFEDQITGLPIEVITGRTSTDASGYYRFDFVGQSRLDAFKVLAASPDTAQSAQRATTISFEGQHRTVDLRMLGLGRVVGKVWDATLAPNGPLVAVGGATVEVRSLVDGSRRSTTSRPDGSFSLGNVAVGNVEVSATYQNLAGSVAKTVPAAGDEVDVDVLLFAGTGDVEGTVFEQRQGELVPAGAGLVVAIFDDEQNPTVVRETVTDPAGHFAFADLEPGEYSVRAVRSATAELVTRKITVETLAINAANLILPGTATVIGTVLYPDGQPAPNVEVVGGTSLVRTSPAGVFQIEHVGVGRQRFQAYDSVTRGEAFTEVDIGPPGGVVRGVTLRLDGRATVMGTVFRAPPNDDQPKVGAEVLLWLGSGFLRTTTNSQGRYQFRDVPFSPQYLLRATDGSGDSAEERAIAVTTVGVHEHDLVFRGLIPVTGVVHEEDGTPVTATVALTGEQIDGLGRVASVTLTDVSSDPGSGSGIGSAG